MSAPNGSVSAAVPIQRHGTFIDGLLAVAVLLGVALNTALGWWWADPLAGLVIVYSAIREAVEIFKPGLHA